jgi:hypothetical protein
MPLSIAYRGRHRTCPHCKCKFIASRSDAKFCKTTCRKAYFRRKGARALEEVKRHENNRRAEGIRRAAALLNSRRQAAISNMRPLGLMRLATPSGILIFETRTGALDAIKDERAIRVFSDDPFFALVSSNEPTTTYLIDESERDFRRVLQQEERRRGAPIEVWFFPRDGYGGLH